MPDSSQIEILLGRLHPLLVHLPIGFVAVLIALEFAALLPRWRPALAGRGVVLALSLPAALLSVLCGWLLAQDGGYDDQLLRWHRWTGVGVAVAVVVAAVIYWRHWIAAYRASLFLAGAILLVASHHGGSLTHGRGYLTRQASGRHRTSSVQTRLAGARDLSGSAANRPAYAAVQTVLARYCLDCHGPAKTSGGLRVDSVEALLKGGESGPAIVRGQSQNSRLLARAMLPLTHDDHMPPDGKPQPGPDDLALLRRWIDSGASPDSP